MVGFIHHDGDDDNNQPSKLKNSIDPSWCDKFDFLDQFAPEIDDLSLPVSVSFPDFDSIKDWIEEMQDLEVGQDRKSAVGVVEKRAELAPNNGFGGETCEENTMISGLPQERGFSNYTEGNGSSEAGTGVDGQTRLAQCDELVGDHSSRKLDVENMSIPKTEHTDLSNEEVVTCDDSGKGFKAPSNAVEDSSFEKGGDDKKLLSLNVMVEKGLGSFSLVDEVDISPVEESSMKKNAIVSEGDSSDNDNSRGSESESESSSMSSSSSSSSSSSDEDDDDDDEVEGEKKELAVKGLCAVKEELEEGEIMDTDAADKMICWSSDDCDDDDKDNVNGGGAFDEVLIDDDDLDEGETGGMGGPIRSRNEVNFLPPVLPVDVTLQPSHQMLPVGAVSSILGAQIIVEGVMKHNPLNEGSILWITEKRSPLGRVDEIFGPVKNPYYVVRYNSENEMPQGIREGTLVSFVAEFVDHVLNNKNIYQKGYDASGENDEEVLGEVEFSDDEKEAEYRRMLKMSKRGNNSDKKLGANKKKNKSFKKNDMFSKNYQPPTSMQAKDLPPLQATNIQNQHVEAPVRPSTDNSIQPSSSGFSPVFPAGPGMIPGIPQLGQPAFPVGPGGFPQVGQQPSGFTPNAVPPNGMPFQIQNGDFASGFQMNTTPWFQQQNLQSLTMMNAGPPFQQTFNPAGQTSSTAAAPLHRPNAVGGPSFSPWPPGNIVPNMLNQVPFSMALQAQLALLAVQGGGSSNMQLVSPSLPQSAEASRPQFNPGASSRHGGRPFQHNRGGHSRGGRRGAQPFKSR